MSKTYSIDYDTIKLLRIPFSFFLSPVFFFAISQTQNLNNTYAMIAFVALHLFIYPASNGYNSYMDRDEESIGGLEHPPIPTENLFYTTLMFDVIGLILAALVGYNFFLSILLYVLVSRAYSYKGIRIKKYPVLSTLVVCFFQGGFTFWMIYNNVQSKFEFQSIVYVACAACCFLIGGVYPLTQIYQHKADRLNGDLTISMKLGYNGTFIFTSIMFLISNALLAYYFYQTKKIHHFYIFQLFLFPVVVYFMYWFKLVYNDISQASFKHTMRMNLIASTCMIGCFITLFILNNF